MGATQVSPSALCIVVLLLSGGQAVAANAYYGRLIGSLESPIHELRGDVYAVDARTLFIKGFSYNGYEDQDTVFFGGSSPKSGTDGFVIPNENGSTERLAKSYDNQDLTLTLPEGKTLKELKWVTLLNREEFDVLGEVRIPTGFDYPRPQRLNALSGIHKVNSDRIYVVDAQTFLIPNFTYDGAAPDAFFWVGHGNKPTPNGIQVPDENGKIEPLRRYDAKTLVLTLPGELTVFDIDWISVWCRAFTIDFGHIRIPKTLNVPPSLKMLGVAPQPEYEIEISAGDTTLFIPFQYPPAELLPHDLFSSNEPAIDSLNNDVASWGRRRSLSPTNPDHVALPNAQSTSILPQPSNTKATEFSTALHLLKPIPLLRAAP